MKRKELALVTGGAGFIASHLTDALIAKGYRVRVLDNLAPPSHIGKIPDWVNKKAQFISGDVRNRKDWLESLRGVSYVFHLASYMDYHLDFSKYIDANTKSTALLYETVVQEKFPIKKIVFASSQSLYGEGKYLCQKHGVFYAEPRPEAQLKKGQWDVLCPIDKQPAKILPELESDEIHPEIPYAISKAASEKLCLTLGKTYSIPTVALRYSLVQGPRQSFRNFYSGALRDFSTRALAGLPIVMQEDGGQIRDFVNVQDVVDAHLTVLRSHKADYQAFNVGSGKTATVYELAKTVCAVVGTKYRPEISGVFRINSARNSKMNIAKLKSLGWTPKRTMKDNVEQYVSWVRNYPEAIAYQNKIHEEMRRENILRK